MSTTVEATFQAGVAALRDGHTEDAQRHFRAVLERDPNNAPALYNLGALAFHDGRSADAEPLLFKAAESRPDHVDTRAVLAAVLVDLKKLNDAIPHARFIAGRSDSDAAACNTAGHVLALAGWSDEAEAVYRQALSQKAAYRPSALALITLLMDRRAFVDVVAVCEGFLAHKPTDQAFHLKRAQALWEGGNTEAARHALLDLLDFAPDHMTAHHNLALFANPPDPNTTITRLIALLGEGVLEKSDAIKAWFTLGNTFAATDSVEDSLVCFIEGNRLRSLEAKRAHAQSIAAFEHRVETVVATLLPAVGTIASDGPTPLIIAGPSRSGKSLLQSWLSGHPDIAAADEVGLLPRFAEIDFAGDAARLEEAAASYRTTLRRLGGSARFVIDTHPTNTLYLDLLLQLCPDAKIIQIQRDPLDLAVSIFARNFVTGGHWADTWQGIATRLKCYDRLRAHWSPWDPVIASVSYEDLVADPDSVLSNIVDALGLPKVETLAPPAVASAHAPLPMPWASFADRPAVNSDAIGLWRPFAPWLTQFAEAYGRDALDGQSNIPTEDRAPQSVVVKALRALKDGQALDADSQAALANVPAFHAAVGQGEAQNNHWSDAVAARWRAASCRPFTHRIRDHVDALQSTLKDSAEHSDLALLHDDIQTQWAAYRESSALKFGDFGLPYQSCTPVLIAGSRDTDVRTAAYDLEHLCKGKRVLDLGCNTGFLTLAAASYGQSALGLEHVQALVDIGSRVAAFLGVSNCDLQCGDAETFTRDTPFDVVIAAAIHGWMTMPLPDLGRHFASLTSAGGAVLFESQGQRSTTVVEEGFQDKVAAVAAAGFQVERQGLLCDDAVNKRAFVILRKDA
ncbi:MAG: tetratricopeptide repeat protein [Rhodospirillaceae bacterium]|nr:tetratricopeptide repeat protein [Rhodospirillaceae bacterium]